MPELPAELPKKAKEKTIYIGVIILVLVALGFAFYYSVPEKYWLGIGIGAGAGALLGAFSKLELKSILIGAILGGALGFLFIWLWIGYGSAFMAKIAPLIPGNETVTFVKELFTPEKIAEKVAWTKESAVVEAPAEISVDVAFPNTKVKEGEPINVIADFTILNKVFDVFEVKTRCFLDGKEIETSVSSLKFEKRESAQHDSLRCSAEEPGKELSVKLEIPSVSEAIWPIAIGWDELKKPVPSKMPHASLYSLIISNNLDQPFTTAEEKDFILKFEKEEKDMKLSALELLEISSKSENAKISCDFGTQIKDAKLDQMEKWLVSEERDYNFPCNLIIQKVPEPGKIDSAWVEAKAIYTVESEYKTSLQILK